MNQLHLTAGINSFQNKAEKSAPKQIEQAKQAISHFTNLSNPIKATRLNLIWKEQWFHHNEKRFGRGS